MKKTNSLHLTFANTAELFAYCQTDNGQSKASEYVKVGSFNTFYDWQTCVRHAQTGWPDGLALVSDLSQAYLDKVGSGMIRETFQPAVSGLFFDVGLVLSGEPESWLETVETEEPSSGTKLITIALNATVSASVSGETIRQRGAAVLALVQLLEASGRSVRVLTGFALRSDSSAELSATLQLKGYGETLDSDKLAFWLVAEDAFRRCFFRVAESCPLWRKLGAYRESDYGRVKAEWIPEGADIALGGLRAMDASDWTPEKTKAWIEEQLRKQGVKLG